jgi:hypothetical protein
MKYLTAAAALVGSTLAHGHHDDQIPIEGPLQGLWYNTLPGDGGTQVCLLLFLTLFRSIANSCRPIPSFLESALSVAFSTLPALRPTRSSMILRSSELPTIPVPVTGLVHDLDRRVSDRVAGDLISSEYRIVS